MDVDRSLPIDPVWRATVEDTIARLERRAATGEQFARLALAGWYAELKRIKEGIATHDDKPQGL